MDIPYIALLWNPRVQAQAQEAAILRSLLSRTTWLPRLERPGLTLLTGYSARRALPVHVMRHASGIILGIIFSRSSTRALTQAQIMSTDSLALSPDQVIHNLSRHYWGGFVALISSRTTGEWRAYPGCSASNPCYYTTLRGVTLVTSDARHIYSRSDWNTSTGPPRPIAVNWEYLSQFLVDGQMQSRKTALTDVQEILAGETLAGGQSDPSITVTWNPTHFVDHTREVSLENYCEELHATAQFCIDAWAREHNWILHSLSGGFDSSLVLSLLANCGHRPHVVCINRYAAGPGEDERDYARLAALHATAPLVECAWGFENFTLNESCLNTPIGAQPSIQSLLYPHEAAYVARLESAHQFDAMWTGEGGDHLFIAYPTNLGVTDFLAAHGMRPKLVTVAKDAARLTGTSIPHLFRDAVYHRLRSSLAPGFSLNWKSAYQFAVQTSAQHPWISLAGRLPPGKAEQIRLLLEVLHRHRPIAGSLDSISHHPLISQPLIEFCLGVPTYDLLCDGRSRGLARRAFSPNMPAVIINRETKGETTHSLAGVLRRSTEFVAEFLLNGLLDKHNLLDRTLIDSLKVSTTTAQNDALLPLCAALAAEVWARIWSSRSFL